MTNDKFRPVVAIEVTGLLGIPLRPGHDPTSWAPISREITFRREAFPLRFVGEPVWDDNGEHRQHWVCLGWGFDWVHSLIERGIEVVWASRYQEFANDYFSPILQLPQLPIAARDDRRFHTTEADWKASQLGRGVYADRPLLWVNDELTIAGKYLLERERKPSMRALTLSKYIPESASENDTQFMDEWLEQAQSPSGHRQLRSLRARLGSQRRGKDFSTERVHRDWQIIRSRLQNIVDFRSGLAAPLAAYAVDHAGELDLQVVALIRAEWGLPVDPPAETLLAFLVVE